MRHFLANIVTYTIVALLFVGAAAFAWMRYAQFELSTETAVLARYEPPPSLEFEWRDLGQRGYERNCANCHLCDGSGWDQYPPVTAAAELALRAGGREYLIDLHLYGLTSDRWGAPMPPMAHMRDVELAAVINYVVHQLSGGADTPLLDGPGDITDRRGQALSPAEVNARRPTGR
ncbi:MAG: cytochrome c [Planctomycetota bacterium]